MMKRTLTVKEFKKYYEGEHFTRVIFHSENQKWYQVSEPCKVCLSFRKMAVYENPNLLCLRSAENTLMLDRIQRIKIDTESSILGTIITVVCGDFGAKDNDRSYILIGQKTDKVLTSIFHYPE